MRCMSCMSCMRCMRCMNHINRFLICSALHPCLLGAKRLELEYGRSCSAVLAFIGGMKASSRTPAWWTYVVCAVCAAGVAMIMKLHRGGYRLCMETMLYAKITAICSIPDMLYSTYITPSNKRDRSITHSLHEFRRNLRSHSWSVGSFFS